MIKKIVQDDQTTFVTEHVSDDLQTHSDPAHVQTTWRISEKLTRNFLCAALVVVCVYAVQCAQLPTAGTLLTAAESILDDQWDENLGRIQFVTNMFPETLSVFWDNHQKIDLHVPANFQMHHAWTQDEPYLSFRLTDSHVAPLCQGTVQSILRNQQEEYILVISHDHGYETRYEGLSDIRVAQGDWVSDTMSLGVCASHSLLFELRQEGCPVNPTPVLHTEEPALAF